jgi:subfamily B ATP-binding cassette protein MsbA
MKIREIIPENRHRRILFLIKQKWPHFCIAALCSVIVASTTALIAYLVKPVLDGVFINKDVVMLMKIPILVLVVQVCKGLAMYGEDYFMNFIGQHIIKQLRDDLYDRISDLSISFFQKEKTGVLMSRVTYDVTIVKNMVSATVTGLLRDTFTIFGLIFVIFYQIWGLALLAIIVLPVAFFPIVAIGRRVRKVSTGCQVAMAELSASLHETFSGNKIVKAFGMELYEKKRFFQKSLDLFKLEMREVKVKSLGSPIMEALGGVGMAFVIWYGGSEVISGKLTPGTYMSFLAAVILLYTPVKKLNKFNTQIQRGLAAVDRIFDIIETEPDIKDPENAVDIESGAHSVTFDGVSFKYDDEMVLRDINLDVQPGEILALAGPSGGGKTSFVNLIPRFYDVASGAVLIDGIDVRTLSVSSLRNQIAIVTQEPILFNESVRNNIAYGKRDATEEEIVEAAKAAYAFDFIQEFPHQFDTNIGELGSRLSGGEKQRICVARALLKNAPILILDEATSSLDTESEALVQKALENLMKGRTTFVIAHRLSTISHANRIAVIVDGEIVEIGKQADLMAQKGEYYKLHQMQFNNNNAHENEV